LAALPDVDEPARQRLLDLAEDAKVESSFSPVGGLMKLSRIVTILVLVSFMASTLFAQRPAPEKKRLLAIGAAEGWEHDATTYGLATIWKIGQESGVYDTYIRTDTRLITKKERKANGKNLDYFDAILFYTSGELDLDDQQKEDFLSFIKEDGKGFIAVHSANDTLYKWPAYGELTGGYFDGHPWNTFEAPIIVEDRDNPITKHFPREFTILDEIYQARQYSRDKVRVLMRLDESKLDMTAKGIKRTDGDFGVSWLHEVGKGRVFYSSLGHTESAWDRPDVQKMYLEAIKWCMGLTEADATPRPRP
jgi:type 1 glutamine amidotransferase